MRGPGREGRRGDYGERRETGLTGGVRLSVGDGAREALLACGALREEGGAELGRPFGLGGKRRWGSRAGRLAWAGRSAWLSLFSFFFFFFSAFEFF